MPFTRQHTRRRRAHNQRSQKSPHRVQSLRPPRRSKRQPASPSAPPPVSAKCTRISKRPQGMRCLRRQFPFPSTKPTVAPDLHGWLGEGNQLLLKKYVTGRTKLVFEFGTWLGLSANHILGLQANVDDFQIVCVDTWEGDWSIKQTDKYNKKLQTLYETFLVNMWSQRQKVVPVKMDGRQAMKMLYDMGLQPDLIYLDMDHSYESAKGDLQMLMHYFPNTVILGDDIFYWAGVAKAVKEIVYEHKITNIEINKNCYALVPEWYTKAFRYKELVTKVIKPKEQYVDYSVAIIAGYHTKYHTKKQLDHFVKYMTAFMKKTHLEFKIFVLTQSNQKMDLNLGHLYNVGFEMACAEGFQKFVFQDLYVLPHETLIPYYRRDNKFPIHLGYHWHKFVYNQVYNLGIIMFNRPNFELINGYPINIEGVFGWDYEMVLRFKDTGLKLKIPEHGDIIENGTHPRVNVREWRKVKTNRVINQHTETWKSNGLKNTFYTLDSMKKGARGNAYSHVYTVNLVDYTYFLSNTEDIVFEFTESVDVAPEFEVVETDVPEKPLKELGYVEPDKEVVNTFATLQNKRRLAEVCMPYLLLLPDAFSYVFDDRVGQWDDMQRTQTYDYKLRINYYIYNKLLQLNTTMNGKNTRVLCVHQPSNLQIKNGNLIHRRVFFDTVRDYMQKRCPQKAQIDESHFYEIYLTGHCGDIQNIVPQHLPNVFVAAALKRVKNIADSIPNVDLLICFDTRLRFTSLLNKLNHNGCAVFTVHIDKLCTSQMIELLNTLLFSFQKVKLMNCKMDKTVDIMTLICEKYVNKIDYENASEVTSNGIQIDLCSYVSFVNRLYVKKYDYMNKIILLSQMKHVSRLIKRMNACGKLLRDSYLSKLDLEDAKVNTPR